MLTDFAARQTGQVLIQVAYAGVNGGCETFRARGEYWFATNRDALAGFPLGAEGVGLVARVGKGVQGLREVSAAIAMSTLNTCYIAPKQTNHTRHTHVSTLPARSDMRRVHALWRTRMRRNGHREMRLRLSAARLLSMLLRLQRAAGGSRLRPPPLPQRGSRVPPQW